jgi:hypothetical protein
VVLLQPTGFVFNPRVVRAAAMCAMAVLVLVSGVPGTIKNSQIGTFGTP